jgi:hypothetical protein
MVHDFSMEIHHQIRHRGIRLIIWIDNAPSSTSLVFNIPIRVPSETPRLLLEQPPTLDIVLISPPLRSNARLTLRIYLRSALSQCQPPELASRRTVQTSLPGSSPYASSTSYSALGNTTHRQYIYVILHSIKNSIWNALIPMNRSPKIKWF